MSQTQQHLTITQTFKGAMNWLIDPKQALNG
jgi:hypothetical protein